ncbi:DUF6221 family protein [Streptomyces sp. NPDC102364]|uniref:DUF6221 family protein n=1 Tax=Streptomyces sp. NPDC102364 TaxID=3366161 RepID=UPI003809BF92
MSERNDSRNELADLCHRAASGQLELRDIKPRRQVPVTVAEWDVTPGLPEWIADQVARRETTARAHVDDPLWEYDSELRSVREVTDGRAVAHVFTDAVGDHIMLNDPDAVLRRCAADRKILAAHPYLTFDARYSNGISFGCGTCHSDGDGFDYAGGNCATILALAEAYGLEEPGEQDVEVRCG